VTELPEPVEEQVVPVREEVAQLERAPVVVGRAWEREVPAVVELVVGELVADQVVRAQAADLVAEVLV
jgi:hypothetical protein